MLADRLNHFAGGKSPVTSHCFSSSLLNSAIGSVESESLYCFLFNVNQVTFSLWDAVNNFLQAYWFIFGPIGCKLLLSLKIKACWSSSPYRMWVAASLTLLQVCWSTTLINSAICKLLLSRTICTTDWAPFVYRVWVILLHSFKFVDKTPFVLGWCESMLPLILIQCWTDFALGFADCELPTALISRLLKLPVHCALECNDCYCLTLLKHTDPDWLKRM